MCSSTMSFLRGSGSSVSTSTVRLPGCGRPVTRMMSPSPSVSTSWPGCTVPKRLQRVRVAGLVPDVPQRAVFFAQPPEGKGLQTQLAGRAHLVQQRHAIEKPHHVALVVVLVDVLEVRIERVVIEVEIGVGVRGALPGIGDGQVFGIRAPGALPCLCRPSGGESRASSRSRSCPARRSAFPWARS